MSESMVLDSSLSSLLSLTPRNKNVGIFDDLFGESSESEIFLLSSLSFCSFLNSAFFNSLSDSSAISTFNCCGFIFFFTEIFNN